MCCREAMQVSILNLKTQKKHFILSPSASVLLLKVNEAQRWELNITSPSWSLKSQSQLESVIPCRFPLNLWVSGCHCFQNLTGFKCMAFTTAGFLSINQFDVAILLSFTLSVNNSKACTIMLKTDSRAPVKIHVSVCSHCNLHIDVELINTLQKDNRHCLHILSAPRAHMINS